MKQNEIKFCFSHGGTFQNIQSLHKRWAIRGLLAHQFLGQLDVKLQEAFSANTSIKFAGGVSAKNARTLSQMLYCDPDLIDSQPKGSFATYIRGVPKSALPLSFPFGYIENRPSMSVEQREELQQVMRSRYANHYTELKTDDEDDADTDENVSSNEQATSERTASKSDKKPNDGSTKAGSNW